MLAEALQARGGSARVHLIDISSQALEQTEQRLDASRALLGRRPPVHLRRRSAQRGGSATATTRCWCCSSVRTSETSTRRRRSRSSSGSAWRSAPGDLLLLGADLVKPEADLILAYDDPLGVTAAFNKNLLVRVNRELGGNFDLHAFAHRAVWNADEQRIEMHLVSRARQRVTIAVPEIVVDFETGEHIWTESSYKYESDQIDDMGASAGFMTLRQWIDPHAAFALTLFLA